MVESFALGTETLLIFACNGGSMAQSLPCLQAPMHESTVFMLGCIWFKSAKERRRFWMETLTFFCVWVKSVGVSRPLVSI